MLLRTMPPLWGAPLGLGYRIGSGSGSESGLALGAQTRMPLCEAHSIMTATSSQGEVGEAQPRLRAGAENDAPLEGIGLRGFDRRHPKPHIHTQCLQKVIAASPVRMCTIYTMPFETASLAAGVRQRRLNCRCPAK